MIGMKRNIFVLICYVTVISLGLISCKGIDWDRDDELIGMSNLWAQKYVESVITNYERNYRTPSDNKERTVTINDTIAVETFFTGMADGDSLNIMTTIVKIDSVLTATTDGYRIADNLTAHIFTIDPGIVDRNGILHIDFYLTDGMIPWAWTEVTFKKNQYFENTKLGWY